MANEEHLAVIRQGVGIWNEWSKAKRAVDPDFRPDFIKADLRYAKLQGADLRRAKLRGADLFDAELNGADLTLANLSGALLLMAKLNNATFINANLRNAKLIRATISGADFCGADIREADIGAIRWDPAQMRGKFYGIRGLDSCYGDALFKRAAADQDFLDTLEHHWQLSWRRHLFCAWGKIDYGRSLPKVTLIAARIAYVFGVIYSIWPAMLNCQTWNSKTTDYFTPFYFSIVTYTTLGFGDISPKGHWFGEVLVSIEVIMGYATLGLLLAVLAEKIARRS